MQTRWKFVGNRKKNQQTNKMKKKTNNHQRKCNVNTPRAGVSDPVCGFAIKVWNVNVLRNLSFVCPQCFIVEIIGCLPHADGLLLDTQNRKNYFFQTFFLLFLL
jgi:hypothetical protein